MIDKNILNKQIASFKQLCMPQLEYILKMNIISYKFKYFKQLNLNEFCRNHTFEETIDFVSDTDTISNASSLAISLNSYASTLNLNIRITGKEILTAYMITYFPKDTVNIDYISPQTNEVIIDSQKLVSFIFSNNFEIINRTNYFKLINITRNYLNSLSKWMYLDKKIFIDNLIKKYYKIEFTLSKLIKKFNEETKDNSTQTEYKEEKQTQTDIFAQSKLDQNFPSSPNQTTLKTEKINNENNNVNTDKDDLEYEINILQEEQEVILKTIKKIDPINGINKLNTYAKVQEQFEEKLFEQIKNTYVKAYWDTLVEELKEEPPNTRILEVLLNEIVHNICSLIPNRKDIHHTIKENIDVSFITNQIKYQVYDFKDFYNLVSYIKDKLIDFGCAADDEDIHTWWNELNTRLATVNKKEYYVELPQIFEEIFSKIDRIKQRQLEFFKLLSGTNMQSE